VRAELAFHQAFLLTAFDRRNQSFIGQHHAYNAIVSSSAIMCAPYAAAAVPACGQMFSQQQKQQQQTSSAPPTPAQQKAAAAAVHCCAAIFTSWQGSSRCSGGSGEGAAWSATASSTASSRATQTCATLLPSCQTTVAASMMNEQLFHWLHNYDTSCFMVLYGAARFICSECCRQAGRQQQKMPCIYSSSI
jgi:hypothetical protein